MKINEHALKYIFTETLFRKEGGVVQNIETDVKFLGKNSKSILIITPQDDEVIDNTNQSFLIKILNSIGLHLDDVVIVNPKIEAKFSFYESTFSPEKIILFGVKPFEIDIRNLDIPTYEIKDFENKPILYVDDLKIIQEDLAKKKALWTNLKQLF